MKCRTLRDIYVQTESLDLKNDFVEKYRTKRDAKLKKTRYNFVGFYKSKVLAYSC